MANKNLKPDAKKALEKPSLNPVAEKPTEVPISEVKEKKEQTPISEVKKKEETPPISEVSSEKTVVNPKSVITYR